MPRHAHRLLFGLYIVLAVVATVQRGVLTERHATFPIFRQSFVHLSAGKDLYATYPSEQGTEDRDRFKYSPTAALFFAPFAYLPLVAGLALWTLLNVVALYAAIRALFSERDLPGALLIIFPSLIAAVQSTSSNALIAALMIATYVALERHKTLGAASALAAGTLMKLYPAATVGFVFAHPRPLRMIAVCAGVAAGFVLAPLLVVSPETLVAQYRSWITLLIADGRDLTFARSIMVVVRGLVGGKVPNLVFQIVATLILVAPILKRPAAMADARFRRMLLASILVFVVIFNHQAENASYVIAAVGLAIWFLASPRTPMRVGLLLLCMVGLEAVPFTLVWLWIQADLLDLRLLARVRARVAAWGSVLFGMRIRGITARQVVVMERLGVVAMAAAVVALSLSPQVRPAVPLKPATLPDAAAARETAPRRRAQATGGQSVQRRDRGVAAPSAPPLLHDVARAAGVAEPADAPRRAERGDSASSAGLVREVAAGRMDDRRGRGTGEATTEQAVVPADAAVSCTVDTLGTAVPAAWLETRVGTLRIESGGVDLPSARLAPVARRLHGTTRPDIVRRELGFRSGDPVEPRRILESVRRLRESRLFSDVVLEGRRCGQASTTDLSVRTMDAWSTHMSLRLGGKAPVQALLLERNLFGSARSLTVGSQERNGQQVFSFGVADPHFLSGDVSVSAVMRLHGDGREWAGSLRTNDGSPLDPWSGSVTSSQIRRYRVDSRKQVVTDVTRRATVLTISRRVASGDAGVWTMTSGVEQELTDLDVTRVNPVVGGNRAHRAFVVPLLGIARRSTAYREIEWLAPSRQASELRVGVEGDMVAGFGRESRAGGAVTHWDGWLGVTAMPTRESLITGDLWTSGYRVRDSVENASVRANVTLVGHANRGTWVGRIAAERVWNPDPDVYALSTADPLLRALSPTSRLAARAVSAQLERRTSLYGQDGRRGIDGALFAAWSERANTLDVAGNPVRVMQAAMVGVGLRQVGGDPRQSPLSIDVGRTIMGSRRLPSRWIVTLSASPSVHGLRARDGLQAPTR